MSPNALLVLGLLLASGPASGSAPPQHPDSSAAPTASYSLYLPSTYTPDRKWPILFCFDPVKRAMVPIELFREAAERYGFIIASSGAYDSADSVGRSIEVMTSLWNDAIARLPVDFDRVYAAGFSGGGRICWLLDQMAKEVDLAGIIEVGAGLPRRDFLEGWQPSLAYYGLVGLTDFNYYEMRWLDGELEARSIPHRLVTFDGGHEWPPAPACAEALDWMQIEAMRSRKIVVDTMLVEQIYTREMTRIGEEEGSGRLFEARDRAAATVASFRDLLDATAARRALDRLNGSKECAAVLRARDGLDRAATDRLDEALVALDRFVSAPNVFLRPGYAQLVIQIGLPGLRLMEKSGDHEERLAGARILDAIYVRAASSMPRRLRSRGDDGGVVVSLQLAADIHPERASVWYDLGCAYARTDRSGDAVRALQRAVDAGFDDRDRILTDPDLEPVRQDTAVVRILRRLGPG